ncbi:MAG TPA: nucleotidyltransferase domain-containing protein [Gammaproteobacteria bacterium]|nr:nucleotidyltransferase domain-containing protein [Gammaproteobacteria bacterium]
MPDMGRKPREDKVAESPAQYGLADALLTTTQQRVLGCLFGRPDTSYSVSELIAATRSGSGAVQRELAKLAGSGLVTMESVGNQKRYRANAAAPIYHELVGIVRKTVGVAEPLRQALAPLAARIEFAFVYGSVARQTDSASSDIDLLVVADDLAYAELAAALDPLASLLGREVNFTLYTRAEFDRRLKARNAFLSRVLQQPRIPVIGSDDVRGA